MQLNRIANQISDDGVAGRTVRGVDCLEWRVQMRAAQEPRRRRCAGFENPIDAVHVPLAMTVATYSFRTCSDRVIC